jgi:hypothetical protein
MLKDSNHSHPPIEDDHDHDVDQEDHDYDVDQEDHNYDMDQDGMDEDSAEEESESSSSEETSGEESEDEGAGEWVPWQEDTENEGLNEDTDNEGTNEETSENEEDDVDGYTLLRHKIAYYKSILRTLRESTPSLRECIFTSADKGLICLFSEICWNVLEGKVDFSKQDKNLLNIFRDQIRVMSLENISWHEKRDFLIKNLHDAWLPVLLTVMKPYIRTP